MVFENFPACQPFFDSDEHRMPELPTKRYHCGAFRNQGMTQEFQSPMGISPLRRGNVEHLSGMNSGSTSPSSLSARSQGNDSPLYATSMLLKDASIRHRIFSEDSVEESYEVVIQQLAKKEERRRDSLNHRSQLSRLAS